MDHLRDRRLWRDHRSIHITGHIALNHLATCGSEAYQALGLAKAKRRGLFVQRILGPVWRSNLSPRGRQREAMGSWSLTPGRCRGDNPNSVCLGTKHSKRGGRVAHHITRVGNSPSLIFTTSTRSTSTELQGRISSLSQRLDPQVWLPPLAEDGGHQGDRACLENHPAVHSWRGPKAQTKQLKALDVHLR